MLRRNYYELHCATDGSQMKLFRDGSLFVGSYGTELYTIDMILTQTRKEKSSSRLGKWALALTALWLITCTFGEGLGGSWGANNACYPYLGCTSGFFGYDAIEHFLFGVVAIFALVWFFRTHPRFSLLSDVRWKNVVILIAVVALVSVFWELLECAHDFFRVDILHQSLFNFRLHLNQLDQPTNLDTMGDLTFALIGSLASLFFDLK